MLENGTGLKRDTAAAIATLFGPIIVVPILFILIEKDDYVRFWAMQSAVTFASLSILFWLLGMLGFIIPFISFFNSLLMLTYFVTWLTYVYKSWQGEMWMAPYVGKIAENLLRKAK